MADFHFTLPAAVGDGAPNTEGVNEQITDHADRAVNRLGLQYRKPKIEALVRALCVPVQSLEGTLWAMYTERFVSTAVGAQLDLIGKVVGQERAGELDDAYRRFIRARITANRSDGVVADLLTIALLVLDDEDAEIVVEPQYPAAIVIRVGDVAVTSSTARVAISLLKRAASAGVRVLFEYSTSLPAATFSFANGPGLGFGAGAFASVED